MSPEQALENCRLYAAGHRTEAWAQTILRFCAEGGATGSPLRGKPMTASELRRAAENDTSCIGAFARARPGRAKEKT